MNLEVSKLDEMGINARLHYEKVFDREHLLKKLELIFKDLI